VKSQNVIPVLFGQWVSVLGGQCRFDFGIVINLDIDSIRKWPFELTEAVEDSKSGKLYQPLHEEEERKGVRNREFSSPYIVIGERKQRIAHGVQRKMIKNLQGKI